MPVTRKKPTRPSIATAPLPQEAPLTAAFTPAAPATTRRPRAKAPATAPAPATTAARTKRPAAQTTDAARKTPAPAAADTSRAKAERETKPRKPKLVRDSFTMPKTEYAVIDELKVRTAKLGVPAKKSEVLRAGIKLLAGLGDAALLAALAQVPALKTGRPGKA